MVGTQQGFQRKLHPTSSGLAACELVLALIVMRIHGAEWWKELVPVDGLQFACASTRTSPLSVLVIEQQYVRRQS